MPPNIVVFFADDQERTTMDAQAMPWLSSHPDWITFPNSWIPTPLCGVIRASYFTGQRGDRHPVAGNNDTADMNEATTIAVAMSNAGYRNGLIGKYLNHDSGLTVPPGWDRWFVLRGPEAEYFYSYDVSDNGVSVAYGATDADYSTDVYRDKAIAFVSDPDPAPFFLTVAFTAPHYPSTPATRHSAASISYADPPDWNEKPANGPAWLNALALMTGAEQTSTRNDRIAAARTCLAMDEAIQDIYTAVDTAGKLANTIFVFFTDNGHAKGRKGLGQNFRNYQKRSPYRFATDALMRVKYPGVAGRTERGLVSVLDIPASILAWGEATPLVTMDGADMTPLINGNERWRRAVEGYYSGTTENGLTIPQWWALRTERWKYAEWGTGEVELYDWNADPDERTNVAAANPAVVTELAALMDELIADPQAGLAPTTATWRRNGAEVTVTGRRNGQPVTVTVS